MKKYFPFLIIVIVALFAISCSEADSQAKSNKKNSTENKSEKTMAANFTLSFNDGVEKSVKDKKNMIVDFYTDWCHWCKVMDEKTFSVDSVATKLSERFVTVRINAEDPSGTATFKNQTMNNVELTRAFGVRGFPSLAFISSEQEIITLIPGYVEADMFYNILDYIDKECYKKQMSFEDFMKKKGDCEAEQKSDKDSTTMQPVYFQKLPAILKISGSFFFA